MYQSTHASVGQNQGRVLYAQCAIQRQIADCKLQIANCDPRTLAPPPFRPPPLASRLTEVLIAMGILTVGLLGVASIFPVASFYMQQGDVADRGSQIAQSAFNDAVSRGMLNPANWLMMADVNAIWYRSHGSFSKPFAAKLRRRDCSCNRLRPNALTRNRTLNAKFGSVYVIDPSGAEQFADSIRHNPTGSTAAIDVSKTLPNNAVALTAMPIPIGGHGIRQVLHDLQPKWPLVRVTLPQVGAPAVTQLAHDAYARRPAISSRRTILRSTCQPKPTVHRRNDWRLRISTPTPDPIHSSRQSRGDYSWLATVVPSTSEARNALATDPSTHDYEVSVAVFHKRRHRQYRATKRA